MNDQRGVIVALQNLDTAEKIGSLIVESGYRVLATCNSGHDLIRKCMAMAPEIVIISYKLNDMTILDVYNALADNCSFLAIVNETYRSFVQEQTDIFCITNPISKGILISSLDLICPSNKKVSKLKEKVNKLETTMEERKIIERAKGILMERENLTEREAFRIIQKNSMDTGSKMIDVAGNIIIQYSL